MPRLPAPRRRHPRPSDLWPPHLRPPRSFGARSRSSLSPPHPRGFSGRSVPPLPTPKAGRRGQAPKSFGRGCRIGFKDQVTDGRGLPFEKFLNGTVANRLALTTQSVTEGSFNLDVKRKKTGLTPWHAQEGTRASFSKFCLSFSVSRKTLS